MTQISISDLQSQDLYSSPLLLKDGQNELINTSIKRSLDARKVSGGMGLTCDITCGGMMK
jgi:hypothetical protein